MDLTVGVEPLDKLAVPISVADESQILKGMNNRCGGLRAYLLGIV